MTSAFILAAKIGRSQEITQWAIDYIVDTLPEYEGSSPYGADLANLLTEYPNCNGIYEDDSWGFIKEHLGDAGDEYDFEENEFNEVTNPFRDPEGFVVRMLINIVDGILANVPLVENNWDEPLELTPANIAEITDFLTAEVEDEQ